MKTAVKSYWTSIKDKYYTMKISDNKSIKSIIYRKFPDKSEIFSRADPQNTSSELCQISNVGTFCNLLDLP